MPIDLAFTDRTGPLLPDRPVDAEIVTDSLPLERLPDVFPAISALRGVVAGDVQVGGTVQAPKLDGEVTLGHGGFRIEPLGVALDAAVGRLEFAGDSIAVDSLVGRSGGGLVRVTGGIGLASLANPRLALAITTDEAVVLDNEHGRLRADLDLAIRGPPDSVRVTGDARIEGGTLYLDQTQQRLISDDDPALIALADTTVAAERVLLPRYASPLLRNLDVAVDMTVARDTWVRTSAANVEVYTPEEFGHVAVHYAPSGRGLQLRGVVATERGDYTFMGRRFLLKNGSVRFIGTTPVDPQVQITAAHQVQLPGREALEIRILVGGTLDQLRVSLDSDAQPPISQSDLISYLAFGRSSSSLLQQQGSALSGQGTSSGQLVGSVAALATQQLTTVAFGALVGQAQRNATRGLGLDVFSITPADLPPELSLGGFGTVLRGTEFDVGKYLTSDLFLSAQVRPTAVQPGLRLEYKTQGGYGGRVSFEPRFLPSAPSLVRFSSPITTGVFGLFVFRDWRF